LLKFDTLDLIDYTCFFI